MLIEKGYDVHGIVRRASTSKTTSRIEHIDELILHRGDLIDQGCLIDLVKEVEPDEVYNLGAMSFVPTSWDQPEQTMQVTGMGVLRMLEACRQGAPGIKFYQAGSSEMFGKVAEEPQKETTKFHPRSPYGCAKAYGYHITQNYRESYDMFCSNGILFNHESERRGLEFVTRKISHHVAKQVLGLTDLPLELGNMDAKRDWGHARDYVEAMWLMLQHDKPDDFVVATGKTHTVRDFVNAAYEAAEIGVIWRGDGVDEVGVTAEEVGVMQGELLVQVNPKFFRPAEVWTLTGDPTKAIETLGWEPKYDMETLAAAMVKHDLNLLAD